ncbi:MAG: RluA family pseudouridine synthase [Chloroflexi bacterium]|nr:RluA family pseudouridine synthase [Chloroflexota bacterium]
MIEAVNEHRGVDFAAAGARLDKFLSERFPQLSRSRIQKLIEEGQVAVNGKTAKASLRLKEGDSVSVLVPAPEPQEPIPEEMPVRFVYEDEDVIVVDKPPGIPVHPAPGHPRHTLVNAILARCPELKDSEAPIRPGIVHRLDMNTSGLMVVARNLEAKESLTAQMKERSMDKRYLALVSGSVAPQQGVIEAPIGRDPTDRKKMAIVSTGREARTRYRVLDYPGNNTLLELKLETGRTHQIRVHLSAIGHPVVGDPIYGQRSSLVERQFLHSYRLGFRHPRSGKHLEFTSELPPDLKEALEQAKRQEKGTRKSHL